MKLQKKILSLPLPPDFPNLPDFQRAFFFDIETTGLSAKNASIYMIGVLFFQEHAWHSIQWLAQDVSEESIILEQFFSFCHPYDTLIHFNGRRFDLPFILERCRYLHILCPLTGFFEFDLYQKIRPLKHMLKLEKLNQKYLEHFLQISRLDSYSGKDLILLYHKYQIQTCQELEDALFLHNLEDLTGMVSLFSFFSYQYLKEGNFSLTEILPSDDPINGFSLKVSTLLTYALPVSFSFQNPYGHFCASGKTCQFFIQGTKGSLKHFFSDYKHYDYLTFEERVIHKTLSSYVERSHRRPAKPEECYVPKTGYFLPQKTCFYTPSFQESYHSSTLFFEYKPEIFSDKSQFLAYMQDLFFL